MKSLIFFLFLFSIFVCGQNYQFLYEYRFKPDSTKKDSVIVEVMRLNVVGSNSLYLSNKMAIYDSIMKASNIAGDYPTFKQQVFKKGNTISVFEKVNTLDIKITDNFAIPWKLESEKKKIEKWECQKAKANFGGRTWVAWFTTEIPLQDGPYYFKGLPGQIISLEDKQKQHQFRLIGVQIITKPEELTLPQVNRVITLDKKGFRKYWQNYRKTPFGWIEQMAQSGIHISELQDENGKTEDINLVKLMQQKQAKQWVERNNNFIDLDLYH